MNELALFAGAGGGILASKLIGIKTICAVECNEYAASVLLARQNDGYIDPFPIWDDICTFDGRSWRGAVDIVSGGFPCQAFSTAAAGRNNAADLWPEMRRVVDEVRPKYIFAENVSAKAIEKAANDLDEMGYKTEALSLSAADLGADHVRERYWLLAHTDDKSELRSHINEKMALRKGIYKSLWNTEPEQSRISDELANRVDKFKAIGNGQVPIVAATALAILAGANTDDTYAGEDV